MYKYKIITLETNSFIYIVLNYVKRYYVYKKNGKMFKIFEYCVCDFC